MTLAMSGATPSDSGLASGLVNTSVQVGGAIGLAVLATLATERTDTLRADGESGRRRAQRRLPPRLPDRRGARGRRDRGRRERAALGPAAAPAEHRAPKHAERRRAEPAYSDAC